MNGRSPNDRLVLHLRGRDALTAFTDALFSAVLKSGQEGLLDPTVLYDRIEAALDDTLGRLWTPPIAPEGRAQIIDDQPTRRQEAASP